MHLGLDARVISDHFPGVGRHVFQLSRALIELAPDQTPELELTLLVDETAGPSRLDPALLCGVRQVPAGSPFARTAARRARQLTKELGFHAVHAPYLLGVRRPGCPVVLTFHDAIPLHFKASMPWWSRLAYRASLLSALRSADVVVTPSRRSADELGEISSFPQDRVHVVPHAAAELFRPIPTEEASATARRLGLRPPYVLCLAGPRPHKNLEALLRAWPLLPESMTAELTLVLVGPEDPRFPDPARRIAQLSGTHRVQRLDSIAEPDLPAALSAARLYVQPSLQEGFGLPIIEAMACGAPVACSDTLAETAGGAAELFDPHRPDDLARVLCFVLSEDERRRRLGELGRQRAAELSWRRSAEAMLEIYRRTASSR